LGSCSGIYGCPVVHTTLRCAHPSQPEFGSQAEIHFFASKRNNVAPHANTQGGVGTGVLAASGSIPDRSDIANAATQTHERPLNTLNAFNSPACPTSKKKKTEPPSTIQSQVRKSVGQRAATKAVQPARSGRRSCRLS
jgi:hypothetical protein